MRFRTPAALERHEKRTCPFRPRERARSSVIGRHIRLNKRWDAVQAAMPTAQVTDRHGNQHTLTGHRCSVYLGHLGASDGTTRDDQRRRMATAADAPTTDDASTKAAEAAAALAAAASRESYGITDTDDEADTTTPSPDTENTQMILVRKHTVEAEAAALELWRVVQSATGPQCYLAYHDGGYSNNKKTMGANAMLTIDDIMKSYPMEICEPFRVKGLNGTPRDRVRRHYY
eukprot:SAG31_NODE_123_length_23712_cov_41.426291_24_plen_231_part_00